jgi:peptidoglycan/LPS O-acetylase OafA/YrhL
MWVIFGHMYSVRIQNIVNALTVTNEVETPFYLLVLASFFAVDVFFYIGGFLVAYSFLRNSMKSIMKYPLAIVHRVLRFWPSYIMAMLIYSGIMIHTGSGPLWYKLQTVGQIDYCDSMWKSIIFIDNIVDNG